MINDRLPVVLSIAGSDPSGGAGIQADLKTATALGVYGAAALTSLTVQNTTGVTGIHAVPADFVAAQCAAVLDDLQVGAIKIGMLATPQIAAAVAEVLADHGQVPVVLDPVMVATSGDRLVAAEVTEVIRDGLLPLATVITPNLPEAGALLGRPSATTLGEMIIAAEDLRALDCRAALVTGGHLEPDDHGVPRSVDVLADADGSTQFDGPRIDTPNTHGTGCTLSTAIACGLATGSDLRTAVGAAKTYLGGALAAGAGLRLGAGSGPVDHLWQQRQR
jgi:hydroxymethylpyrimidine/phosphomethylpyrimidine kinase